MKKNNLVFCILIVGILFLTGCLPTAKQSNSISTSTPIMISSMHIKILFPPKDQKMFQRGHLYTVNFEASSDVDIVYFVLMPLEETEEVKAKSIDDGVKMPSGMFLWNLTNDYKPGLYYLIALGTNSKGEPTQQFTSSVFFIY